MMPYTYPSDYERGPMTTHMPPYPEPRTWTRDEALRAAHSDSCFLISPHARHRAVAALQGDDTPLADAARVILHDGGAQQGGKTAKGNDYISANMEIWREADDLLALWCDEQTNRQCTLPHRRTND